MAYVHVHGHPLPPSSLILADFGSHLDSVTASMLLARLSDLHTCPGNPEPKFVSLANAKRNKEFLSSNNEVVAYADAHAWVSKCERNLLSLYGPHHGVSSADQGIEV